MAQQDSTALQRLHAVEASLLPLGIAYGYEHPISRQLTLSGRVLLAGGLGSARTEATGSRVWVWLVPTLRLEPRYYYNFQKRAARGRTVRNNAASFLALTLENQFNFSITTLSAPGANLVALLPKWGLRRTLGQHGFWEGSAGVGAAYEHRRGLRPAVGLDVRVGYAF